ncbi:Uncharacterised protein [Mycobacteroides abscessus subsp. massiliense]|nr:Uncharacterised protein [Mycobacteroides abscessus subsp. massiliense]
MHGGALAVRIHRLRIRGEHQLHALLAQLRDIGVQCAWIGLEILPRTELQRVDENGHHDNGTGHLPGVPDQRQMALMQRTHGRHQDNPSAGVPQRLRHVVHGLGVVVNGQLSPKVALRPLRTIQTRHLSALPCLSRHRGVPVQRKPIGGHARAARFCARRRGKRRPMPGLPP